MDDLAATATKAVVRKQARRTVSKLVTEPVLKVVLTALVGYAITKLFKGK